MIHVIRYLIEGDGSIPKFVADGGYFPKGNELVGISVDDSKRHLPLTVVKMTRADLEAWLALLPGYLTEKTAAEVVSDFLTSKGIPDYV